MEIKKVKLNELYNSLPNSWDSLKYKHYKQIVNLPMMDETPIHMDEVLDAGVTDVAVFTANLTANINNTAAILSVLLDVPVEAIMNLEQRWYLLLADRIKFIYTQPDIDGYKSDIQWKDIESITTNDYITFFTLAQNPVANLGAIIKQFTVNKYSDEQVNEMSALEVNFAFFRLAEMLKKSTTRQIRKEQMKLLRYSTKAILTKMFCWKKSKI